MTPVELLTQHRNTIKALLFALFGNTLSQKSLAEITGIEECARYLGYGLQRSSPVQFSRKISIATCLHNVGAVELFASVNAETGSFFASLRAAALGRELDSVRILLDLANNIQHHAGPEAFSRIIHLAMRCLLDIRPDLSNKKAIQTYFVQCFRLFPMLLVCGYPMERPDLLFHKARGLARILGDRKLVAFSELMIGATNICNQSNHGCLRNHQIMTHGREELYAIGTSEELIKAALYLAIWHFLDGSYYDAMQQFKLASIQMREAGQPILEMYCLGHECFSAFNLGQFDYAEHQLLSRIRQFSPRNDNQLARTIRGQLASCLLRTGKLDNALDHLDISRIGSSPRSDIVSWIATSRQLSYYHILSGNLNNAYNVFHAAMQEAHSQHYFRPLYLSSILLEILYTFYVNGYPPIPGYDFQDELQRCLNGPSRLLKGIAIRIKGELLAAEGHIQDALACYQDSLETLKGVSILDVHKVHLSIANIYLQKGDKDKAAIHALPAWSLYDELKQFWPEGLLDLLPHHVRSVETLKLSRSELLSRYRENILAVPYNENGITVALNLLITSCHTIKAQYASLFYCEQPESDPVLIASVGPDGPQELTASSVGFWDFIRFVRDNGPQIIDNVFHSHSSRTLGRMLIGIPMSDGRRGSYILCHEELNAPEIRYLLNTELLEDLGSLLEKQLHRVVIAPDLSPLHRKKSFTEQSEIISVSAAMKGVLDQVNSVADTSASVLISGESGTGKELIARRIHERSGCPGRMVSLNMAGLSDDLLASELFGYEKGAFTGAQNSKPGLIEMARGGTLFLDEITESSLRVQAALLRVLESRQFYRVGSTKPQSVDFRLITASNRSIKHAIAEKRFRSDLYYRISSITLRVPSLRERPEDIAALAFYFLHFFANKHGRSCVSQFSHENMQKLLHYSWPGNVRELKNVVEQSVLFSSGNVITLDDTAVSPGEYALPQGQREDVFSTARQPMTCMADFPSLSEMEERYIRMVMDITGGRINGQAGALEILKMNRSTLYARLKEYGLRR